MSFLASNHLGVGHPSRLRSEVMSCFHTIQIAGIYFFFNREGLVSAFAITIENVSSCFEAFPQLVIDQSDVSDSWTKFSDKILLALEFRELKIDSRY